MGIVVVGDTFGLVDADVMVGDEPLLEMGVDGVTVPSDGTNPLDTDCCCCCI